MSNKIIILFIVEFILLALTAKNPGMCVYGVGGAVINVGILMMNN